MRGGQTFPPIPPPPPGGGFGPLLLVGGVAYKSEEMPPPPPWSTDSRRDWWALRYAPRPRECPAIKRAVHPTVTVAIPGTAQHSPLARLPVQIVFPSPTHSASNTVPTRSTEGSKCSTPDRVFSPYQPHTAPLKYTFCNPDSHNAHALHNCCTLYVQVTPQHPAATRPMGETGTAWLSGAATCKHHPTDDP